MSTWDGRNTCLWSGATRPSLDLNFLAGALDPSITFTRAAGPATYFDATGTLQTAGTNVPRFDNDPSTARTNVLRNNIMVGAVTGTPGTLPTNWTATPIGLSQQIVGTGIVGGVNYIDVRFFGTTTGQFGNVQLDIATSASSGQNWSESVYLALVGGSLANVSVLGLALLFVPSSNVTSAIALTGALTRFSYPFNVSIGGTTGIIPAVYFNMTGVSGQAADFTLRIGMPQLEFGINTTAPIPTSGAAVSAGATPLGLLIEESRLNGIRNSTMVGAAAGTPGTPPTNWLISPAGGLTSQIVATGTEGGISYIDVRFSGTTNNTVGCYVNFDTNTGIAALTGQTWILSSYLRLVAGSFAGVTSYALFILDMDSVPTQVGFGQGSNLAVTSAALAAQRNSFSHTIAAATTASILPRIAFNIPTATAIDFTIRIGAPQCEQGVFATSFIPTTAGATTRAADTATMPVGPWFNAAQGTLVAEAVITGEPPASFSPIAGFVGANANTDLLNVYAQTSNLSLHTQVKTGNTGIYGDAGAVSFTYGSVQKGAIAYSPSSARSAFNGTVGALGAYGAPATLPTLTNLLLFGAAGFQTTLSGYQRRVRYWPRALSAGELQGVTA